jgi:hypothetical protein
MSARFGENRGQSHKWILVSQMIGNPEPFERMLRHRPLGISRRLRRCGQRIELHAKTHLKDSFLDWISALGDEQLAISVVVTEALRRPPT